MKKYLLIAAAVLCAVAVNAKVWRVNPNGEAKADFLSVNAADESEEVLPGDTLYCEPGVCPEQQRIHKNRITILGPGWGFKNNIGSTGSTAEARFTNFFTLFADSIYIAGLYIRDLEFNSGGKHITIERCHLGSIRGGGAFHNIDIRNNFFVSGYDRYAITLFSSSISGLNIENNIVFVNNTGSDYGDFAGMISLEAPDPTNVSALIAHNTIVANYHSEYSSSAIRTTHSVIRDNIIINLNPNQAASHVLYFDDAMRTNQIYNNVFSLTEEGVSAAVLEEYGDDNYFVGATMENTFTCTKVDNAEETYLYLKEGSVAAGKAFMGEDCGAYAGGWPYVVHCRPLGLPYIYDVVVPEYTSGDEMSISFKVKANNQ